MTASARARALLASAGLLACASAWLACREPLLLPPEPGLRQFEERGLVPVPGGAVNAADGNLSVSRLDLSLDTILGTHEVRARYDAAGRGWRWNFEMRFDGETFTDETGARHAVSALAEGEAIPGTVWVVVDADTVRTKGGLAYHFDADGRLRHMAWTSGEHPRVTFAWNEASLELSQCTGPAACAALLSVALDPAGRPERITDLRTGRAALLAYDAFGRLESARDAVDVARGWPGFRYEYEGSGTLLTAITNSEGERIEYDHWPGPRLRSATRIGAGDPADHFEFRWRDADGLYPVLHTNPLGGRTLYRFDAQRRLRSRERLDGGERWLYTWSGVRVASETLPNGARTEFRHAGDDPVEVVEPSGNVVWIEYEPGGVNREDPRAPAVRRVEDGLGLVLERGYDASGRLASERNGAGETTSFAYNGASLVSRVTAPDGRVVELPIYGVHGHWLEARGALHDQRSFDAAGNAQVESVRLRPGGVLARAYDGDRNLAALEVAATEQGQVAARGWISIDRRSDGRLRAVSRPGGADAEFVFDALGRAVQRRERVDGTWHTTRFELDAAGNRTAATRPNGMREEVEYDLYGRTVRRRALRHGALEGEIAFEYRDGQLVSVTDSIRGSTELRSYDPAGRQVEIRYESGETARFEYDLRSRVSGEVLSTPAAGRVLDLGYAYDLADRRVATRDRSSGRILLERVYADGALAQIRYGNGLVRSFAYDPETGWQVGATTRDASGAVVEETSVTRGTALGPPRRELVATTTTALASTREVYQVGLGGALSPPSALVGARVFGWNDGAGAARAYRWDELGNRAGGAPGDQLLYNAERNRLLSAALPGESTWLDYDWDEAGFATRRGGEPVGWTATGRLASLGAAELVWDMSGRLVSISTPGGTREFTRFGGRVESEPGEGALGVLDLGEVAIDLTSGAHRYRHLDFRGNVSFVSDEAGAVTGHSRYHPFGRDARFGPDRDPIGFEARREVGPVVLMDARPYDPVVGRFLAPDPVFPLLDAHAYTSGNPLAYTDASGLLQVTRAQVKAVLGAIAFTAGAAALLPATPVALVPWLTGVALGAGGAVIVEELRGAFQSSSPEPAAPGADVKGIQISIPSIQIF